MSFKKQHQSSTSRHASNDMYFRPSAMQIAKMNLENPDKKVTNADFDPEIKLNYFGQPAFFQPQNTVQARMKKGIASSGTNKTDSAIQKMPEEDQDVQAKAKNDSPSAVQSNNTEGNPEKTANTGMPSSLKSGLESLSGEDLSGVRVHRNSSKPDEIGAHAYAQGEDIYLGQGQEKHLPHEGWHVVQQKQGRVQSTIQQKDAAINDDAHLEKEADVMGERAVQMKSKDVVPRANKTRFSQRNEVIQRAMKFEYQFFDNKFYRDTGKEVHPLPRKFGPRDYIMRSETGARLESETKGQIEFETTWEKKWSKLLKQVKAIQYMSKMMNTAPNVKGSDGKTYQKFPFHWAIQHLKPNKGFSTSGGKWNSTQKDGDATVYNPKNNVENFRSTASYASDKNILQTIKNGEKVFVHYFSSDGMWARITYNGKFGWIWNKSLKAMDNKHYENNSSKNQPDKPLEASEKLLVSVSDPSWTAYIQVSESFELEQYESFLKQHDKKRASSLIPGTRQYLLENNPEKAPNGENLFEKTRRQWKFLAEHNKLKNLLLMVGHYIENGRSETTLHKVDGKLVPGSAKYALSLLSRTHFGSMYKSMSKKEQTLFKQMVYDKKSGIIPTMGLTNSSKFFKDGTGTGYNPTVYSWLVSITQGKDNLSTQSGNKLPAAMGRFNMDKEKGKHQGLVRFEARKEPGNSAKLEDLDDHAFSQFMAAAKNRSRPKGKNKTGLEL